VRSSGVAPRLLRFEIAESAAISNMARSERLIRRLREMGSGVALDDFGVAINSLSYLKCLPVSCVKIDASLTKELPLGGRHDVIIETIAQLARSRNIECVAECVESAETAGRLKDLGVGCLQGFLVHKPEPLRNLFVALRSRADSTEPQRIAQ
jgi:EAL domain-containing protein (putative c-di-GMP-specific phosphodiesterase class I)